jgi:hypothetical protein
MPIAHTFLPFWPGGAAGSQAKGLRVAWVWPLIDTPQQNACPSTLATPELATSVASGGRLNTLLDSGSAYAQADDLTWAIDPALLSDVSVMTHAYATNGSAECKGRFTQSASPAASTWLSTLKTVTSAPGSASFLTPYANVDAAALSHSGQEDILKSAYQLGDTVANQVLPGSFGKNGGSAGGGQVLNAAMPADGLADSEVLASLAADGGVNTVLLSSAEQPSSSAPGEDALAKATSDIGTNISVLFANSRITSLLGTASATPSQASQFNLSQDFLAQTAMIAAESQTQRSLVIEPPTGWNPSPAEAEALLSATQNAKWLHVTGISDLAGAAGQSTAVNLPPQQISHDELSDSYIDNLGNLASNVSLFKDLLYKPSASEVNSLSAALTVTASSAWRGRNSPGGWLASGHLTSYLNDAWNKVRLVSSTKVLLTGQSAQTTVSVQNGLDMPIAVQVTGTAPASSDLQLHAQDKLLKVQKGGSATTKMSVQAGTIGTKTAYLQLTTADGMTLPGKYSSQRLSIEVTRFGRSLLIIIAAALGILILTSVYRVRRKRATDTTRDSTADEMAKAGGTG